MSKFCWETNDLWRDFEDFNYVNAVGLSHDENSIAVGEDGNCLRIYRNPCVSGKNRKFRSHSGNVFNLCWTEDDSRIASVGADRCLVIWRVTKI